VEEIEQVVLVTVIVAKWRGSWS